MLLRRCAILALTLATAGMLIGQSIEPKGQFLPDAMVSERLTQFKPEHRFTTAALEALPTRGVMIAKVR